MTPLGAHEVLIVQVSNTWTRFDQNLCLVNNDSFMIILTMKEIFIPYGIISIIVLYNIFHYTDYRLVTEGLVNWEDNKSLYYDEVETKHDIGVLIESIITSFKDICQKWKKTVNNPSIPKDCDLSGTCVLHEGLENLTSSTFMKYKDKALDRIVKIYQENFH